MSSLAAGSTSIWYHAPHTQCTTVALQVLKSAPLQRASHSFEPLHCLCARYAASRVRVPQVKHAAIVGHLPVISLPLSFFSLTAPSLGLLLVFRTNACYGRWDNARKVWGSIINKTRSLVRQGNTFFVEDTYPGYGNFRDYRRRIAAETSAFTRCLRCFLRGPEDEEKLRTELKGLGFTPQEVGRAAQ